MGKGHNWELSIQVWYILGVEYYEAIKNLLNYFQTY